MRVLGLMSGTSADGVDLVRVAFGGRPPEVSWQFLDHRHRPYPPELRRRVLKAMRGEAGTRELALLHHDLGRFFAEAAEGLEADLATLAGQTVWHEPPQATLQLGEAAYLAEALGVPVVADLRPSDLAAGGEGAPLVPYPDLLLFGEQGVRRAILNVGGIANVTYLPGRDEKGVLAFDTGPGNALIDEAAERLGLPMDEDGRLAREGQVLASQVAYWLAHPYFDRPPPKSTGREVWRLEALPGVRALAGADLVATVTRFVAEGIARAIERFVLPRGLDELWVAGGGAKNPVLMAHLKELLPVPVRTFGEATGLDESVREPLAFALLGYLRWLGLPNVLPQATGARRAAVAGKVVLPSEEGI